MAVVAACAIGLYLVWRTRNVLRLAAIALFVALTLNPIVDATDRRIGTPRAGVILLLYAAYQRVENSFVQSVVYAGR